MATIYLNQSDFSKGEIDERLLAKTGLKAFGQSALRIRNTLVDSRANLIKRFGFDFVRQIIAASDQFQIQEFIYDEENIYLFLFTDNKLTIFKNDAQVAELTTIFPGSLLETGKIQFVQQYNFLVVLTTEHQPYYFSRGGDDTTWIHNNMNFKNLPTKDFKQNYDEITFKLSDVGVAQNITLTSSGNLFDDTYIGGLFQGVGSGGGDTPIIGSARITAVASPTEATVEITSGFDAGFKNGITGKFCVLEQPSWSDSLGWPIAGFFYEGRLVLGGAPSSPDQVAMSVTNSYRDMDVGTGQPDDAIVQTIADNKVGLVKYISGDKTLQIFCSRSEYTVPQFEGQPLEPPAPFRRQSGNGIFDLKPFLLDNQTFYVQKGGKVVRSYNFDNDTQSYRSVSASLFSAHLIREPIDGEVYQAISENDNDYFFLVNNDGTLAAFQTSQTQEISAWSLLDTLHGNFRRITQVGDDLYVIVEREIDSSTRYYLEKVSFDHYLDSAKSYTFASPTTIITGLEHLEGETVRVVGDDYVLKENLVLNGQITIERPSLSVIVGEKISSTIRTVPISYNAGKGQNTYQNKRIVKYSIDYYETLGLKVNDYPLPDLTFEVTHFDEVPALQTGIYTESLLSSYDPRETMDITHDAPLPFTIRGIGFEVSLTP